jgi:hydrogenase maturation protease
MKPRLVIGLGNPLMGDEGVGWYVASRLAGDPRLPDDVEVIWGGTDLLRYASRIEGRSQVVVVDAVQDAAEPGTVARFEDCADLDTRQTNAHELSAAQAMRLLQMMTPVPMTLLGVSISAAVVRSGLSAEVEARMPAILDLVLEELRGSSQRLRKLGGMAGFR